MQLITTAEVAKELGLSKPRILQLVKDLDPQPRKVGNMFLFTPDQVEMIRNRNTKPGPKPKN